MSDASSDPRPRRIVGLCRSPKGNEHQSGSRLCTASGHGSGYSKSLVSLMCPGSCRGCNSNHCQCSTGGSTPNIAAASSSNTTPTLPMRPSPYPLSFPPNFASATSSDIRDSPSADSQYVPLPQFTGMPSFDNMFRNPSPSTSHLTNNAIAAQVQHFRQRQNQLMNAHRLHQEAILRSQNGEARNLFDPLRSSLPAQSQDATYYQRTSVPSIPYGISSDVQNVLGPPDQTANLQHQAYPNLHYPGTDRVDALRYFQDNLHPPSDFSYAASLSNHVFRPPPPFERPQTSTSILSANPNLSSSHVVTEVDSDETTANIYTPNENNYPTEAIARRQDAQKFTDTGQMTISAGQETSQRSARKDLLQQYSTPAVAQSRGETSAHENNAMQHRGSHSNNDEIPSSDLFSGFDDSFEAADNEWLFSLQTPCAQPGAVCQCGDSCCCPGCFTHMNNPGNRKVLGTIVNKRGVIHVSCAEKPSSKEGVQTGKRTLGNPEDTIGRGETVATSRSSDTAGSSVAVPFL
jgi:hypothetical protein